MKLPDKTDRKYLRVGLCVHRSILPETMISLLMLERRFQPIWHEVTSADVVYGRNTIANDCEEDWLLFVDADMSFATVDVERLFASMEASENLGAIAALAIKWDGSATPCLNWKQDGKWLDDEAKTKKVRKLWGEIVYVDSFGAGLLLIRGKALREIEPPRFECGYDDHGGYYGEDTGFCQNLQEAGWKTAVHLGVPIGHIGPTFWHANILKPEVKQPSWIRSITGLGGR